jgi:hypothetical protein
MKKLKIPKWMIQFEEIVKEAEKEDYKVEKKSREIGS